MISKYRYTKKLSEIENKLDYLLDNYSDAETDPEILNKYSMFFVMFGEEISKDIKQTFWGPNNDYSVPFFKQAKQRVVEAGLADFDIDGLEDYILEITYFLDWLEKRSINNPDMKDDVETYAEHFVNKYKSIYKEFKRDITKEVSQEANSENIQDLMKAFTKARI